MVADDKLCKAILLNAKKLSSLLTVSSHFEGLQQMAIDISSLSTWLGSLDEKGPCQCPTQKRQAR